MPIYPPTHEHKQVVDALKTGDPAVAEREMGAHLESAFAGMEFQVLPEDYISL
jgi:DNA-binding GntR family transcriptional regulator